MQPQKIQLMTTAGCHLCDQALAMVEYLTNNDLKLRSRITLQSVEIAQSDELIERFGIRIPVLVSAKSELGWPFELSDLKEWLTIGEDD